ncbi:ABC transporter ATP-binding protein [bacterium]|nr:ABC transporter ATP-binding protein [bacterium]
MMHSQETKPILEVNDLCVVFKTEAGRATILDKVSFKLQKNKTLGIVGESGSGKTITALSVLNLIPSPPLDSMSGEIRFQGENLLTFTKSQLRKVRGNRIAYIFQEPMTALNPVLTIGDQIVEMIRAHNSISKKEARDKAVHLLTEVGITSPIQRLKNYPHEISGGMRQRAMIAIALSCDPDILIADEPTTALDVTIQAQVLDLFKYLIESRGMSIIFVTHDLGVIAEIADDILVLQAGKTIEYDSIDKVFHDPQHPYTQKLLSLIKGGVA